MSAVTKSATALKGLGWAGSFLVIDPGKRTGWNLVVLNHRSEAEHNVGTYTLEELPALLRWLLPNVSFVVCEDYSLLGGSRRNDPKMPSAQGIGMCRCACEWTDTQMYLVQPNQKAPAAWRTGLDEAAREHCRNDHERDVVDLAVHILRTLEKTK